MGSELAKLATQTYNSSMKIGRNEPCPCGSGKKYKKCHLDNPNPEPKHEKHHFNLKGKVAEEIVQYLAEKTFFADWCYKNPILENGKELCDLLVVFGETAIIYQIKNLKLDEKSRYKKGEVDKNLRQLVGAKRTLFTLNKTIELSNPNRGKEAFNPKSIKEIFLISALVGKGEDYSYSLEEFKKLTIHVFDREFTQVSLNELDTIKDFIDYLRAKERLIKNGKEIMIVGGEKELLAFYLMNDRSFNRFDKSTMIILEEGAWKNLQRKPEYRAKKLLDEISYGWDAIISRAHETRVPEYERIAREMARLNRFERRYFSKGFVEAHMKAHKDEQNNNFRRIIVGEDSTYCFLFMDDPEPRDRRKAFLSAICFIARGKYKKNKRVLGIATEMKIRPRSSYDFCLLDKPTWNRKDQKEMEKLQKETGIFANPEINIVHEDEYPSSND